MQMALEVTTSQEERTVKCNLCGQIVATFDLSHSALQHSELIFGHIYEKHTSHVDKTVKIEEKAKPAKPTPPAQPPAATEEKKAATPGAKSAEGPAAAVPEAAAAKPATTAPTEQKKAPAAPPFGFPKPLSPPAPKK